MTKRKKKSFLARMLSHVYVGTAGFIIVALPAVVLSFLIVGLKKIGVDEYTIWILTFLKYGILTVDVLGVFAYIVSTAWGEIKGYSSISHDDEDDDDE